MILTLEMEKQPDREMPGSLLRGEWICRVREYPEAIGYNVSAPLAAQNAVAQAMYLAERKVPPS